MHKCYKEGETQFLMYLQKLFHSIHCAYRNPQAKFGVDTFIYKKNWNYFYTHKLLSTIFKQTKIVLGNVLFFKFFLQLIGVEAAPIFIAYKGICSKFCLWFPVSTMNTGE